MDHKNRFVKYVILRRFGTSAEPILSFIRDAKKHYFEKHG